jgi:A/G-specific adenine glycosylase
MPWRFEKDPYKIFVSELMLQQTGVSRVMGKYEEFLKVFPDFAGLAAAPLSRLLKAWSGLGYNSRAVRMRDAARIVMKEYGGTLPQTMDSLVALPGIGKGTAGAILAYAFNLPAPFIETNIRRVFLSVFFPKAPYVHDRDLMPVIEAALDRKNPREWHYALMDYGSTLAKSGNANVRSAHYVRQSRFAGSVREARGALVRLMSDVPAISYEEAMNRTGIEPERFKKAVAALEKEGYVKHERGMISLTD